MGLEVATYVSDLVATNPTTSDPLAQGDDHIRLLKAAIKASFPLVNGPLNASMVPFTPVGGIAATTVAGALEELDSEKYSVGGALGTPASGNLANCTFPTLNQNTTGTAANASAIADGAVSSAAKIAANIIPNSKLARAGSAGQVLYSGGAGADPYYGEFPAIEPSVGVGQTWQYTDRAFNTNFWNLTGKPIMVIVVVSGGASNSTSRLSVDGVELSLYQVYSLTSQGTHLAIVPNGSYYALVGSITSIVSWAELR